MLTQNPKSRRTTIAGNAAVGILASVALGLTASGTAAAERVRAAAAAIPAIAPISAWQSPTAPAAAVPAAVLPAPDAPPAPVARERKPRRDVVVTENGKTIFDSASIASPPAPPQAPAAAAAPEVAQVIESNCNDKRGHGSLVMSDEEGGKRRIIICRQGLDGLSAHISARVAAQASAHAAQASAHAAQAGARASARAAESLAGASARAAQAQARAEHARVYAQHNRRSALTGLRSGRAAILREKDLTDEQRKRAIEGIDQAIREMEASHDTSS